MKYLLSIFLLLLSCNAYSIGKERLNLLTWADYIQPSIIKQFEQETGITVNADYVDSHYSLEAKIVALNNDYDVIIPTLAPFFIRQVQFGLFQPIDYSLLKNSKYLDPRVIEFEKKAKNSDDYGVPFMLDTVGIGYDHSKITSIMPDAPIDSLKLIFDPNILKNFSKCGIEMLDSPEEIIALSLLYLGLDPNSESEEDLKKAAEVLYKIRPYINNINSSLYFNNLGSGDACIVVGYSGDIIHAKQASKISGKNIDIKYILPKEGSVMNLDLMAIPMTSPNKENAYKFIDFILRPEINASIANFIGFTSPNIKSYELIRKDLIDNPNIYPLQHQRTNLYTLHVPSSSYNRMRNRAWMKFLSDERN
jgi:putrescine transport system substrate-binding protein